MMSPYPEDRSDRQSPSRDLPPGASCEKKYFCRLWFPTKDSYDILFTLSMTARSGLPIALPARQSRTAEPGPLSSLLRRGDIFSPDIFFSLCESKRRALFCLSTAWFRFKDIGRATTPSLPPQGISRGVSRKTGSMFSWEKYFFPSNIASVYSVIELHPPGMINVPTKIDHSFVALLSACMVGILIKTPRSVSIRGVSEWGVEPGGRRGGSDFSFGSRHVPIVNVTKNKNKLHPFQTYFPIRPPAVCPTSLASSFCQKISTYWAQKSGKGKRFL